MNKKFNLLSKFLLVFFVFFVGVSIHAQTDSADAIAIRVIPNTDHYSAETWYRKQAFTGSPQAVTVDGYDGVRDGHTVYVNVANINDQGTAAFADDEFYTNIYLITYNENATSPTIDIFSQILKHWKFNTNLENPGTCMAASDSICVLDSECALDDYCRSYKARVTRDAKRLESLTIIGDALSAYKNKNNRYPLLQSGSYLPHKSLSVWPSWQRVLAQSLGINLPQDPINKLGKVEDRFDKTTGWDEDKKEFAADLNSADDTELLPESSLVMMYRTNEKGDWADYCAQLETGYANIESFSCAPGSVENNPPRIVGANLVGWPGVEFSGLITAVDPDGDPLLYTIELITPDTAEKWVTEKEWQWDSGYTGFRIDDTSLPQQKKLHALSAGLASLPGAYKIKVTVDDQRGAVDSQKSAIFDITVRSYFMQAKDANDRLVIGNSGVYDIFDEDGPLDLFGIDFRIQSATYNGIAITPLTDLSSYGIIVADQLLNFSFGFAGTPNQKTGLYHIETAGVNLGTGAAVVSQADITIINNPPVKPVILDQHFPIGVPVTIDAGTSDPDGHRLSYTLAVSPAGSDLSINSSGVISGSPDLTPATYTITVDVRDEYYDYTTAPYEAGTSTTFMLEYYDNPPELVSVLAAYANGSSAACVLSSGCNFAIDNGENASIRVSASDPDPGQSVHYRLVDDFSGLISIDEATGIISGLNNLNYQGITDMNYTINVTIDDGNCDYVPAEKCSTSVAIGLQVKKFCSVDSASVGYANHRAFSSPANLSFVSSSSISDFMSALSFPAPNSCSTIGNTQATITALPNAVPKSIVFIFDDSGSMIDVIDQAISALKNAIDTIYSRVSAASFSEVDVKVGLLAFDFEVHEGSVIAPADILLSGHANNIKDTASGFAAGGTTATNAAVARARSMLSGMPGQVIVLLSDGVPDHDQDPTSEVNAFKSGGGEFFSLSYVASVENMCAWSSNNGENCTGNSGYYYEADEGNVNLMYDKIVSSILSELVDPVVSSSASSIHLTGLFDSSYVVNGWTGLNPFMSCSDAGSDITVVFGGSGSVTINNIVFDYCDPALHY